MLGESVRQVAALSPIEFSIQMDICITYASILDLTVTIYLEKKVDVQISSFTFMSVPTARTAEP